MNAKSLSLLFITVIILIIGVSIAFLSSQANRPVEAEPVVANSNLIPELQSDINNLTTRVEALEAELERLKTLEKELEPAPEQPQVEEVVAKEEISGRIALIYAPNGEEPIEVEDLRLDLRYEPSGIGVSFYDPSDYPSLENIPLKDGRKIQFDRLSSIEFSKINEEEKIYIPVENRERFAPGVVDDQGYRTITVSKLIAELTSKNHKTINDELALPKSCGVWLTGETDFGPYEFDVWKIENPLKIVFAETPLE